jgi:hypothetical protein
MRIFMGMYEMNAQRWYGVYVLAYLYPRHCWTDFDQIWVLNYDE